MSLQTAPPPDLPALFGALADPTRLAMAERLMAQGEMTVGALAEPFEISLPTVSRHIGVLERAGLIERRADKQRRLCRAKPEAVAAISGWLERHRAFWSGALDRLEAMLIQDAEQETAKQVGKEDDHGRS